MPASFHIRETGTALSFKKQVDIATAQTVGNMWGVTKTNQDIVAPIPVNETDENDLGKGNEFVSAIYPSRMDVQVPLSAYLTSEWVAWAAAFGLGASAKTGSGNYTYTCTPLNQVSFGRELPYFSYVESVRQAAGVNAAWDVMYPGLMVSSFRVKLAAGTTRATSTIDMQFVGSGKQVKPSAITIPSTTAMHSLPVGSAAITIMGNDYVSLKNILALEWGWDNNPDTEIGFYPGSGADANGYNLRGTIEAGDRKAILSATVRVQAGSPEYAALVGLTTGTAVISQTFNSNNTYTATFHKVGISAIQVGTTGSGLLTYQLTFSPMWHSSNGILTVVAKCQTDAIGE